MVRLTSWGFILALATGFLAPGSVRAEDKANDLLEQVRLRQKVANQAMELDVENALKAADALKGDPAKAADVLKQMLVKLRADEDLPIVKKSSLKMKLEDRLKLIEDAGARAAADAAAKQKADLDRKLAELKSTGGAGEGLRRDLDAIKFLRQQGQFADASRLAAEVARRYPGDPAAQQALKAVNTADAIRQSTGINQDKALASNRVYNDVARASIAPPGDVNYPPGWLEKMNKRKAEGAIKLTETETAIVKALESLTAGPINFENETFEKILEYMQKQLGQPMVVNKAALKDLDITYEKTLSVSLPKNITKRSMLRSILSELGLTYIVKGERIEITDVERAKQSLTVRVYRIDDLLTFGTGTGIGANGKTQVDMIMEMIKDSVEPASWDKNNGPGSITYDPVRKALIIKNSAEIINMIGGGTR